MPTENPTTLGDDFDGGVPGYGRTLDEAIADAHANAGISGPEWYTIVGVFVRVENPIREYKAVIVPGGGR